MARAGVRPHLGRNRIHSAAGTLTTFAAD
jgi:hypothetical protein